MKKKLLYAIITVLAINAATISVMAEETNYTITQNDLNSGSVTKNVEVVYKKASEFTVMIPKKITLNTDTKTASYNINALGNIAGNEVLVVAPADAISETVGVTDFKMSEITEGNQKPDVTAVITQSNTEWTPAELAVKSGNQLVGTTKGGSVSAPELSAGSWSGNVTFNIQLREINN